MKPGDILEYIGAGEFIGTGAVCTATDGENVTVYGQHHPGEITLPKSNFKVVWEHPNEITYFGYHPEHKLPIKQGDTVLIKKGTLVKNIHFGTKPAGRTYRVKVNHTLPGQSIPFFDVVRYHGDRFKFTQEHLKFADQNSSLLIPIRNPSVCWPGPGGYWSEVDINQVEKVS